MQEKSLMRQFSTTPIAAFVGVTLGLLAAPCAQAQTVFGSITGIVTQNSLGAPGVNVGDAVSGTYSYDPSVLQPDAFNRPGNPLTSFTLDIGHLPHVFTLSDLLPGLFSQERLPGFSTPSVDYIQFFFDFNVLSTALGQPIGSQGINLLPQSFSANSSSGSLAFNFRATPNASVTPEGSSLAMFVLGGIPLVVGFGRKFRRKTA
jgi:hypothetical protein